MATSDETSPIFEIHGNHSIKIWADGRVAIPDILGEFPMVVNRIPATLKERESTLLDQFAMAIITGAQGGWLRDEGAKRELARRAYAMARVMLEERSNG